jgi:oligoendopeptidase F
MSQLNRLQRRGAAAAVVALLICCFVGLTATRAEGPVTWDLTEIYPTDQGWDAARKELAGKDAAMDAYRGRLGSSAPTLKKALDEMFALQMRASRLGSYAGMRGDEDLRESGPQGMLQSLRSVMADLQAATAWIDPEILAIPQERIQAFLNEEPDLAVYRRYLERLEKQRPHVLDSESERLLGMTQRIRGTGSTISGLLRNAEIPWPTITLSDGAELRVDPTGYVKGRASVNRDDRIASYDAFYGQLEGFKGSFAASLSATVQEHIFNARARSYDSSLEAALSNNEVDPAVYHMLIKEINAALPTLYRYLELRGKILGVEDLRYHDSYPDLVAEIKEDYSWEKSKQVVGGALKPLGDEYVARFLEALDSGWVDVYPRTGKRAGAYVNDGAYEVHPYMLLNHQDDYESASTLAHEGGHLMHSWYSQEAQSYPTSRYVIFVAEVASTFNQVLLFHQLMERAEDDAMRLSLLGNFLEGMRTTVFRQTMFAEFELAIHEAVERGEALTGDSLNALYLDMLRRYHGEAEGVMTIDELYAVEWAYIPHFHYNFYVYQYATSNVAAIALAEGVEQNRSGALERYLDFLRSGSTKPPVELLADAGVDMTGPEPIRAAMRMMNEVMDQIDEILARR